MYYSSFIYYYIIKYSKINLSKTKKDQLENKKKPYHPLYKKMNKTRLQNFTDIDIGQVIHFLILFRSFSFFGLLLLVFLRHCHQMIVDIFYFFEDLPLQYYEQYFSARIKCNLGKKF